MFKNYKVILLIAAFVFLAITLYGAKKYKEEKPENGEEGANDMSTAPSTGGTPSQKNFKLSEFNCKDGTAVPVELYGNVQAVMNNLQALRDSVGAPITINSAYRTPSHNKAVGGATNSMHLQAKAADIKVLGMTPTAVKQRILELITQGKMQDGGIGLYSSFVHYDLGPVRRWNG